jgi:hypothetical protein
MTSWPDHLSSGNQKRFWRDPVKRIGDKHADDVQGATTLGYREYELRDLIAAVRA